MAIYRTISMGFWTDGKIVDDFTPEDRYFYLYLFTNPHTNLCGCYEVSLNQIANEVGYNRDSIVRLVERFESIHNVIRYSKETKEMLLINWHKYNWTASEKFRKPLEKEINNVKHNGFRDYLTRLLNGEKAIYCIDTVSENEDTYCIDTVSDKGRYGIDTSVTVTVTDTVSNTVTDNAINSSKANIGSYSEGFEEAWKTYPRKKEKAAAYKAYKARLHEYSEDQLLTATKRYAEECRILNTEERYIKHGATFFGPSLPFADYLAEDWKPPEDSRKQRNGFHNFEQRDYDFDKLQKAWGG